MTDGDTPRPDWRFLNRLPMTEIISGSLYDYPTYYDLVYGSDWQAEYRFLRGCFDKHAARPVRSLFEPACGTGRLLIRFAQDGYDVAGNDLNANAVEFCNARFERRGFPPTAVVGDMSAFLLKRKVDAMYNMINSFRHLTGESAAESHLHCVARGLAEGGIYVLGIHLTPTAGPRVGRESWSARRGNLAVTSSLWSEELDLENRVEQIAMECNVYTPTRQIKIVGCTPHRTYTAEQLAGLFACVPDLQVMATYDFAYDIDRPIVVDAATEDVVYVLRRK
jgi:SAM-dependent methyltransferase